MKDKSIDQKVRKHTSNKSAENKMTKVKITLSPGLKESIEMKVKSGLYVDMSDVVRDAFRALHSREISSPLINVGDGDIEALAFIVLMQVSNDMNEDLKMIMAEVKTLNKAKQEFKELISKVSNDSQIDSFSEMLEMTSLRLQKMMERRSKFISTLSNIMKKISTTHDALVQNLK